MPCSDEAHKEGGHTKDCGHDGPDRGGEFSLFQCIDVEKVRCLNESEDGSIRKVFKSWDQRFDITNFVESDCDAELLVTIPFNGVVKLKSIAVLGYNDLAPSKMKAWINKDDLDFDAVSSLPPLQEWDLVREPPINDILEYPTRMTKFTGVRSLTLLFPENFANDETTKITYIGLKGEFQALKQDPGVIIYELNANPADHPKIKNGVETPSNLGL